MLIGWRGISWYRCFRPPPLPPFRLRSLVKFHLLASPTHLAATLELMMRANKQLTLGSFEFDIDRQQLVFRITNLFDRERFDADIVSSMVHCAIAELDRIVPLLGVLMKTPADLLEDLSLPLLLEREDLLPPVPEENTADSLEGGWEEEL